MHDRTLPLVVVPTLDQLAADPLQALDLKPKAARELLVRLAPLVRALELAIAQPEPDVQPVVPAPAEGGDRLLNAEQVALALGLEVGAVARHRFPFARKLGRRTVRYSEAGLKQWMRGGHM
jgi:predicted DNA-binding transcriptional regulator AlpA